MRRANLIALFLLLLPGCLMLPLQKSIRQETQLLKYGGFPVTRELRDQISQGMAIALLAGFRGVVADFIWIQGHGYWEKGNYFKQVEAIENAVKLQPQSVYFWDSGAWHMGWNISFSQRVATNNLTAAQGISRERAWHERARDFLERGIENVPNRYDLYFSLAWLYEKQLVQDCGGELGCLSNRYEKAAAYYEKAAGFQDAPAYLARDAARCLERSGDAPGAYDRWRKLWIDEKQKKDFNSRLVIPREIHRLENELAIPESERMSLTSPADKSAS